MKMYIKNCFLLVLLAGATVEAFSQCESVYLSPSSVSFPYTGGTEYVTVNTSGYCSGNIQSQPAWATASNYGTAISVSANENTGTARSGTVVVVFDTNSGPSYQYISVSQSGYVQPPPSIFQHPATQNKCNGAWVTFSVRGSNITSYQWQESRNSGGNYADIPGATAMDYSFQAMMPVPVFHTYKYRCVVSNASGSVTSNAASLIVTESTTIVTHPSDVSLCYPDQTSASFSVGATGTNTYRWEISTDNGVNFVTYLDQPNGPTLVIANAWEHVGHKFRCEVIGGSCGGGGYSQAGTIRRTESSVSVSGPQNQIICAGTQAEFSVGTAGTVTGYQWQEATNISTDFYNLPGQTSSFLRFTPGEDKNNYKYRCIVYGLCGASATSGAATLQFFDLSIGIIGPQHQTVCRNTEATFQITASGNILGYQWQWRPQASATFANLPGATTPVYKVMATDEKRGYQYRCIVYTSCNASRTSDVATLDFIDTPITIWKHPQIARICVGKPVTLTVQTPTPAVQFQWQLKTPASNEFVDIPGATGEAYTLTPTEVYDEYLYRVKLTKPCYTTTYTNAARLWFDATPDMIKKQPVDVTVCAGNFGQLEVETYYSGLTYQWQASADGGQTFANLPGETQRVLRLRAIAPNGDRRYRCVIGHVNCQYMAVSQAARLYISNNPAASATITQNIDPVYNDDAVTLTVSGPTLPAGDEWEWFVRYNGAYTAIGRGPSVVVVPNQNSTYYVRSTACAIDGAKDITLTLTERFSGDRNYIHEITPREALDYSQIYAANAARFHESITYFDGLGRPMQEVKFRQSPAGLDVVTPIAYDAIGRTPRTYLPYTGEYTGKYKTDALKGGTGYTSSAQYLFYNHAQQAIAQDTVPFGRVVFEPSPLDRPLQVFGPGQRWGTAEQNKPTTKIYTLNAHGQAAGEETIVFWRMSAAGVLVKATANAFGVGPGGVYASDQLRVTVDVDEHGYQVRQYTNKKDQVVVRKTQVVAGAIPANDNDWAITFYVYDDRDNLVAVVPPEGAKALLGQ